MARMNVYVPDALYARLQRERRKCPINVSEVCQEALSKRLDSSERERQKPEWLRGIEEMVAPI